MKKALKLSTITSFLIFNILIFSNTALGAEWSTMESGVTVPLRAVWGSSVTNVFVVGDDGTIIQYNGSDWSAPMATQTTQDFHDVWGSSGNNVYAVGNSGTIIRYTGSSWSNISSSVKNQLRGIWGSSASDIHVVGQDGTILQCDANQCSKVFNIKDVHYNAVWGDTADDVYAVGEEGTILHFDGVDWTEVEETGTTEELKSVWGDSATNVFAVGLNGTIVHFGGNSWQKMGAVKTDYWAIGGLSDPDIFAAGVDGNVISYSSGRWSSTYQETGTNNDLLAIWLGPDNDAFIVGFKGTILFASENRPSENTAPTASFTITPESGAPETTFFVSAETSTDFQDSTDILEVRWDWENDGTWDTDYTTAKIASHPYTAEGTYTIKLEVKDSGGLTATTTKTVEVNVGDDDKKGCPAKKLLGEDSPSLTSLRTFRDRVLARSTAGSVLISLYYARAAQINGLLESNPGLKSLAKDSLETLLPVIELYIKSAD